MEVRSGYGPCETTVSVHALCMQCILYVYITQYNITLYNNIAAVAIIYVCACILYEHI